MHDNIGTRIADKVKERNDVTIEELSNEFSIEEIQEFGLQGTTTLGSFNRGLRCLALAKLYKKLANFEDETIILLFVWIYRLTIVFDIYV